MKYQRGELVKTQKFPINERSVLKPIFYTSAAALWFPIAFNGEVMTHILKTSLIPNTRLVLKRIETQFY